MTDYLITEHGAVADGQTVNTSAIQAAVDACAAGGGGRLVVPAGTFVSGSIFLKSNVEFHLSPGALLLGSSNLADYQRLDVEGHGYHVKRWLYAALLCGVQCENVSITGAGTVDGNGPVWWAAKNRIGDMEACLRTDDPFQAIRPPLVFFFDCTRVKDAWIHGCTAAAGTGAFLGEVGSENDILLENNRLGRAQNERGPVEAENRWNTCSHAYTGSRWIRDAGERNVWLPMPEAVEAFVRGRWTLEQVDGIWSVSRVEANARDGAEVYPAPCPKGSGAGSNIEGRELRSIYIIESRYVDERLVVFEDGELLRTIDDPNFHAHFEDRREDFELERIDREADDRSKDSTESIESIRSI